jgi:hypothetical protein
MSSHPELLPETSAEPIQKWKPRWWWPLAAGVTYGIAIRSIFSGEPHGPYTAMRGSQRTLAIVSERHFRLIRVRHTRFSGVLTRMPSLPNRYRSSSNIAKWWARSDSNRGPRDSLDPAVSGGSGLSLHPLIFEEKGVRDALACH